MGRRDRNALARWGEMFAGWWFLLFFFLFYLGGIHPREGDLG
jgi:hypothetical protein